MFFLIVNTWQGVLPTPTLDIKLNPWSDIHFLSNQTKKQNNVDAIDVIFDLWIAYCLQV